MVTQSTASGSTCLLSSSCAATLAGNTFWISDACLSWSPSPSALRLWPCRVMRSARDSSGMSSVLISMAICAKDGRAAASGCQQRRQSSRKSGGVCGGRAGRKGGEAAVSATRVRTDRASGWSA